MLKREIEEEQAYLQDNIKSRLLNSPLHRSVPDASNSNQFEPSDRENSG